MTIPDITRLSDVQLHQLKAAIYEAQVMRRLLVSKPEAFHKLNVQRVSLVSIRYGAAPTWYMNFNDDMNFVIQDMQNTLFSTTDNPLWKYRRIRIGEADMWYTLEPRKY